MLRAALAGAATRVTSRCASTRLAKRCALSNPSRLVYRRSSGASSGGSSETNCNSSSRGTVSVNANASRTSAAENADAQTSGVNSTTTHNSGVNEVLPTTMRQVINASTIVLVATGISTAAYSACPAFSSGVSSKNSLHSIMYGLQALWAGYVHACEATPVFAKACTSGCVYWVGDILSQVYERREHAILRVLNVNSLQCIRSALIGVLLHGPLSHVWFMSCDAIVGPSNSSTAIATKILLDQVRHSVCSPT